MSAAKHEAVLTEAEPRWPAMLAGIAVAALYWWLPERLTPGPSWLGAVAILIALAVAVITHRAGLRRANRASGFVTLALITTALAWSLGMLILGLPTKKESAGELLRAAVALWTSNILVFATWYWRLDAGGPHSRDLRGRHEEGAFLFPQMMMPDHRDRKPWKPGFVDYLFLAFNTSTAFSPTDVPVLSRWAKVLMMVQSSISLGTLAILAARAVNIL
jgi:hypothetical protein